MSLLKFPYDAVGVLNCFLALVVKWLNLNLGKTEVVVVGKADTLKDIMLLTFGEVQLTLADSLKN